MLPVIIAVIIGAMIIITIVSILLNRKERKESARQADPRWEREESKRKHEKPTS